MTKNLQKKIKSCTEIQYGSPPADGETWDVQTAKAQVGLYTEDCVQRILS